MAEQTKRLLVRATAPDAVKPGANPQQVSEREFRTLIDVGDIAAIEEAGEGNKHTKIVLRTEAAAGRKGSLTVVDPSFDEIAEVMGGASNKLKSADEKSAEKAKAKTAPAETRTGGAATGRDAPNALTSPDVVPPNPNAPTAGGAKK